MAYITPAEMLVWYSPQRVGELCATTDQPVSYEALLTDVVLQTILDGSASEIDAAVRRGQMYTIAQLDALAADQRRGGLLRRLNADIAASGLIGRKMIPARQVADLVPRADLAMQMLEQLRQGERIFDTADQTLAQAGVAAKSVSSAWNPNPYAPCLLSNNVRAFGTVKPPWPFPAAVGGGCNCGRAG